MNQRLLQRFATTPLVFFCLFTISGFAGLIYESIWTHYLKLFLGHAAYAQTLVLAIFMGGMALGSWVCARYGKRWRNLILGYALVEGVIGLLAFAFHEVFASGLALSYDVLIPALGAPLPITIFKWSVSALLILPQSVLLGMTFPMMSAGVIRRFPDASGRVIATLYFSNSIGAAVGVLVSGFLLLDWFGLPGTLRSAGLLNIAVALAAWYLQRHTGGHEAAAVAAEKPAMEPSDRGYFRLLLLVALGTGAASFIYEVVWIRMLSLVMGGATHSFELMLSAFILGLALGGWWIRRRVQAIANILGFLAWVQVVMGLLAITTLLSYNQTFDVMRWLMQAVGKDAAGYFQFQAVSHGLALLVMLPATICAGMTLPLITFALLARGVGEKAIGSVYAFNTLGAIIGVFFAVHIGFPVFGLKGLLVVGAAIDVMLGGALWGYLQVVARQPLPWRALTAAWVLFAVIAAGAQLDLNKMLSGVYRGGIMMNPEDYTHVYHQDGKTATIDVIKDKQHLVGIRTNGKVDASIYSGDEPIYSGDEPTMVLAALAPLAFMEPPRQAAAIGFGSGLSTHALLAASTLQAVDTVEIEQAMITGARQFMFRVARAYNDPRSHIYIDDAKTFFSTYQKQYDLILSEPSNPWVSGVAGLFTTEFYRHVTRHLSSDGVFVQWLQLYETNIEVLVSVVRALDTVFSDYVVITPNDSDMLLLARQTGSFAPARERLFEDAGVRAELASIGIHNMRDFNLRVIGNRNSLHALFDSYAVPANGDYYPYVDLHALKARFLRAGVGEIPGLRYFPVPIFNLLARHADNAVDPVTIFPYLRVTELTATADDLAAQMTGADAVGLRPDLSAYASMVNSMLAGCQVPGEASYWVDVMFNNIALGVLPQASPPALVRMLAHALEQPCQDFQEQHLAWLGLLYAIATADTATVARQGKDILLGNMTYSQKQLTYVLIATVAAMVADGGRDAARELWRQYAAATRTNDAQPVFQWQDSVLRLMLGADYQFAATN